MNSAAISFEEKKIVSKNVSIVMLFSINYRGRNNVLVF